MFEVGLGYLWFTVLEPQGAVVQIDPVDGGERARIRLAWLRGPGFVWLAAMNRQGLHIEVRRFDPVIARFVGQPLVVPRDLDAVVNFGCTVLGAPDVPELVLQDDALWLTSTCDGEIVRIQL